MYEILKRFVIEKINNVFLNKLGIQNVLWVQYRFFIGYTIYYGFYIKINRLFVLFVFTIMI